MTSFIEEVRQNFFFSNSSLKFKYFTLDHPLSLFLIFEQNFILQEQVMFLFF